MSIKFINLSHDYPLEKKKIVAAIKDINLEINEKDEFVSIVGKTGSGKSTLIEHINGLLLPTKGEINILGDVLTPKKKKNPKLTPIRKKVGFVFQFPEYQLFEETVIKDIKFAPLNFGEDEATVNKRVKDIAKRLEITNILNKSPFSISGGQMRKVAIAGILAYDPEVIVLDEPTRGLDPKGQEDIMELFDEIRQKLHKTIIMITHDMDLAYKYSTRMVVLENSKIVYDGAKEELFKNESYSKYNLDKPQVLKTIDYLNQKLNLNIDYNTYSIDQLLLKLKEVYHG